MAQIGRPPSKNPRTHAVPVRFSDDEYELLKDAATMESVFYGQFIRDAALTAARRTIRAKAKQVRPSNPD